MVGLLETIEVKKKAVELSEKLLRDNQARLEAGVLNSTEVRTTETQLMRNRQSLLSSRLDALRIEDQVRAALNLKNLPVGLFPSDKPKTQFAVPGKRFRVVGKNLCERLANWFDAGLFGAK